MKLSCNSMEKKVLLVTMIIYFLNIKSWLEIPFSLSFNCFLNNIFSDIKFLLSLLHLPWIKSLRSFLKNQITLNSFKTLLASNCTRIDWKYSSCKVQFWASSSWYKEFLINFILIIWSNNLDSLRFFRKIFLKSGLIIGSIPFSYWQQWYLVYW